MLKNVTGGMNRNLPNNDHLNTQFIPINYDK